MSSNLYVKLKQILPPAPVLVGLVTAHHDEDDTSTVVLPTNEGRIEYAAGVAVGSTIRPRGTTVPVGEKAFVRNGVIETRAPDGDAIEIEVGRVVPTPVPLVFGGPIADQAGTVGDAFSLNIAGHWTGGLGPLAFTVAEGALPAGLTLSAAGVISGTLTTEALMTGLVFRATDTAGYRVSSNAFEFEVTALPAAPVYLVGPGSFLRSDDGGATWTTLSLPSGWTSGYDLMKTPTTWVMAGQNAASPWTVLATSSDLSSWTILTGSDLGGPSSFPPAYKLAFGPSRALGVNNSGNLARRVVASTDDGVTWSHVGGINAYGIQYHAPSGLFVAATAGTGSGGAIRTSPDGVTWTTRYFDVPTSWGMVAISGSALVAVPGFSTSTPKMARSTDGVTWSGVTPPVKPLGDVVGNGSGGFICGTGSDNKILYSTDAGATWGASAAFTSGGLVVEVGMLAWTGSEYLAVVRTDLYEYRLYASTVGDVWTLRSTLPVTSRPMRLVGIAS